MFSTVIKLLDNMYTHVTIVLLEFVVNTIAIDESFEIGCKPTLVLVKYSRSTHG